MNFNITPYYKFGWVLLFSGTIKYAKISYDRKRGYVEDFSGYYGDHEVYFFGCFLCVNWLSPELS